MSKRLSTFGSTYQTHSLMPFSSTVTSLLTSLTLAKRLPFKLIFTWGIELHRMELDPVNIPSLAWKFWSKTSYDWEHCAQELRRKRKRADRVVVSFLDHIPKTLNHHHCGFWRKKIDRFVEFPQYHHSKHSFHLEWKVSPIIS